jgi:hypothetical protein
MTSTPVSKQQGTLSGLGYGRGVGGKAGHRALLWKHTNRVMETESISGGRSDRLILVSGRVFALLCFAFFSPRYLVICPYSPSVGRFMEILVWSRGAMNTAVYLANTTQHNKTRSKESIADYPCLSMRGCWRCLWCEPRPPDVM